MGITPTVFALYFENAFLDYVSECFFYQGSGEQLLSNVEHAIRLGLGLQTLVNAIIRYDTANHAKICPENEEEDRLHASACENSIHLAPTEKEISSECARLLAKRDEAIAGLKREIAALTHEVGIAKAHVSRLRQKSVSPCASDVSLVPETHWLCAFPTPPDVQLPLPEVSPNTEMYDSDSLSSVSMSSCGDIPDEDITWD